MIHLYFLQNYDDIEKKKFLDLTNIDNENELYKIINIDLNIDDPNNSNTINILYKINNNEIYNYEKKNDIAIIYRKSDKILTYIENSNYSNDNIDDIDELAKYSLNLKKIDNDESHYYDNLLKHKFVLYLNNDQIYTIKDEYILQRCIANKIIIISNKNFSNNSYILNKFVINIKDNLLNTFLKFSIKNYKYIYDMLYNNDIYTNQITKKNNDFGFIIIRHVNSIKTNYYWIESYKCIRKYYTNKIIIIDDNSNYDFIKYNNIDFVDCEFINSEYKGRAEILAYYYYYKNNFFKKAIIIHDSTFINKYIDFNKYNGINFIWHFTHHWDNQQSELKLLNKVYNNNNLKKFYYNKNKWYGCFGIQSVIDYTFLKSIVLKYNIFSLINYITTRPIRMDFERIFALICFYENRDLINKPSIFGIIHHYIHWGYTLEQYLTDKINNNLNRYDIIKVWTGR